MTTDGGNNSAEHDRYHREQRKHILQAHPDVRSLIRKDPALCLWAAGLNVVQVVIAISLAHSAWWAAVVAAIFAGAFISHALNVIIHEAAHELIFAGSSCNRLVGILANATGVFPTAVAFRHYHLLHYRFLGVDGRDPDMPQDWEVKIFDTTRGGKLAWLLLLPIWYALLHPLTVKPRLTPDRWFALNAMVTALALAGIIHFGGWNSVLYLVCSVLLSVGCHPAGEHILQEHVWFGAPRETSSYYGPMNLISFDFGHHTEHHDFSNIPTRDLHTLTEMAPEFYVADPAYRSRTRLLWAFVIDRRIRMQQRNHASQRAA